MRHLIKITEFILFYFLASCMVWAGSAEGHGYESIVYNLKAMHRHGQTFITWGESSDAVSYRLYRYQKPITGENFSAAKLVADIPKGSAHVHRNAWPLQHFAISDMGLPLKDNIGLYVISPDQTGEFYYAITCINALGQESKSFRKKKNSLDYSVTEKAAAETTPILQLMEDLDKVREFNYVLWGGHGLNDVYYFKIRLSSNFSGVSEHPLLVFLAQPADLASFSFSYPNQSILLFLGDSEIDQDKWRQVLVWATKTDTYYVDRGKVYFFARETAAGTALRWFMRIKENKSLFKTVGLDNTILDDEVMFQLTDSETTLPSIVFFTKPDEKLLKVLDRGGHNYRIVQEGQDPGLFITPVPVARPTHTRKKEKI